MVSHKYPDNFSGCITGIAEMPWQGLKVFAQTFDIICKMALFLSQYVNKIDKKDRVSIPSSFRGFLMNGDFQGVILFCSHNHQCLEGFDGAAIEDIATRMDDMDMFSGEQDDMATTIFGGSHPLNLDGDGRIVLTQSLKDHAVLTDQALFVGLGRKFQIWNPDHFVERNKTARASVQSKSITLPKRGGKVLNKAGHDD